MKRLFSVAPMLDWTDRHERYFLRLMSQHAVLYTEMITTGALIYGDRPRFIRYHQDEHPVAIQLGGSDPVDLASCAKIAEDAGFDEININVGCPSNRVQSGMFGACLMAKPERVAQCVDAMRQVVDIPVTIKHRIGIDEDESAEQLFEFVETVSQAGCETFIVHARKAWLKGLSPKENRDVPPLRYEMVHELKQKMPELEIIINGGLCDLTDAHEQLQYVDGVMLGREVYHNPFIMTEVDQRFYGKSHSSPGRLEIIESFYPYMEMELSQGTRLHAMSRHILGLFNAMPGARKWRRYISENAPREDAGIEVIKEALKYVS